MGAFFVYIIKSAFCLALFYLFYRLLLSKETFHRFNRIALLGLLVASCVVPLIQVDAEGANEVNRQFLSLEEMLLLAEPMDEVEAEAMALPAWGWREVLLLLYILGIIFFLVRNLWSLARMIGLIDGCRKEKLDDGVLLFTHNKTIAPFSWMKCIVLSEKDCEEGGETIITHERAHIRNRHSWDLLLADVCVFFQWFNPAAWLLKQELQNIHEYEADEWVINQGIDAKKYQLLLIKKAVGTRLYSMANSLNHSSLKKRIAMMIKKKSNPWARLKYLYILPLAAASVAAFARPEISNELNEISSVKVNDLASIVKANEEKSVENSLDEKFKVSGQVMEKSSMKPVVGASIIVRGTSNGTLSDKDGKFELPVKKDDVLVVSFVGLQTQSLPMAGAADKLVVWMLDEVQNLEEMTVIGYASNGEGTVLDAKSAKKVVQITEIPTPDEPKGGDDEVIFQVVEEMPSFPGGMGECMKFLARNMKYPVAAQKAKIEGRVIVQFVVDRDGSVNDIKVVRSISPELDAEALRVVGLMPKWNPGKQRGKAVAVKYTMPITFHLEKPKPKEPRSVELKIDKDATSEMAVPAANLLVRGNINAEPTPVLVIVDGVEKGTDTSALNLVKPEEIESITVMKSPEAIKAYGEKGKDGVILITTKENK